MTTKIKSAILLLLATGVAQVGAQDSLANRPSFDYYSPSNILRFGDFLWQQGDYLRAAAEYQRYLFAGFAPEQHRVFYQLGCCYLKTSQPEQAAAYFRQAAQAARSPSFQDSAAVAALTALLVAKRDDALLQTFDSLKQRALLPPLQNRFLALEGIYYLQRRQWEKARAVFSTSSLNDGSENPVAPLARLAERGKKLPRKSPGLAGVMSAVMPGSGKIYAGRTADGLYSLVIVAGASWLAYEGFRDAGASSFKGWFFGGAATLFYAGNIYGATVAARLYNERFKENLAHDVAVQLAIWADF
jgi:tetratricopeptide (TPR) repeat protein